MRRIAEAISEDNSLAEYLASIVQIAEDFELLAPVELSILLLFVMCRQP